VRHDHEQVRPEHGGDEAHHDERALEEQVGEREPVVLVQDDERERDRGVVTHQLGRHRLLAGGVMAQVQRHHGEGARAAAASGPRPPGDRRRSTASGASTAAKPQVSRRSADRLGAAPPAAALHRCSPAAAALSAYAAPVSAMPRPAAPRLERGVDDHRGEEPERGEGDRGDQGRGRRELHVARAVDGQRPHVPDEAEAGGGERDPVGTAPADARGRAQRHPAEHRVERDARAEPQGVHEGGRRGLRHGAGRIG
jgi:hypothetical protein